VVLCLLPDAEAAQVAAASRGDRGHPERHRIGSHGEPADRISLERHRLKQGVRDRKDPIGSAGGLLGIEKPGTCRSRLQGELPALHRVSEHVISERVEHGGQFGEIAHPLDSTDDALPVQPHA